ncbi:MAG: hypothetical protein R3C11_10615 [Planctomycetaceae bacterium]
MKLVHGADFNYFNRSLNFSTTGHFLKHLWKQKLNTGDIKKLCITLVSEANENSNDLKTKVDGLGISYTNEVFNIHDLDSLNAYEQKQLILEVIQRVLLRVSTELGWNCEKITHSFNKCLQDNLIDEGFFDLNINILR